MGHLVDEDWAELYRIAGEDWADKEAAASVLEDTKGSVMAQRQAALGDIAVNRAEQIVRASPEWVNHINLIVQARKEANLAKVHLEVIRMKYMQEQTGQANRRAEVRMLG
tara:strand:+ start:2839 stop:3168 length:330 start_codon:yes stop_codon:yes gene_type:complete